MTWRSIISNLTTATSPTASLSTTSTANNRRLPVLADEEFIHQIKYTRSGLIVAIKNLQSLEALAEKQYAQGNHTDRRSRLNEQVHKNLCQNIAQQAHLHARYCYPFEHVDLVFDNVDWTAVPACRRALRDCLAAIVALELDPQLVSHNIIHPPVQELIDIWWSPAFNITKTDFHAWIYVRHFLRHSDIPYTRRALF
jgi:hypothetical protein